MMTIKILKKVFLLITFVSIFACNPTTKINFNSSEAFFKSLEKPEKKISNKDSFKNPSLKKVFKNSNNKELKKKEPNKNIKKIQNQLKTKKLDANLKTKKLDKGARNSEKKKRKSVKKLAFFNFNKYIDKKENELIKFFGKPNLLIKHGIISNYQYHLKNCFVDLFFINNNKSFVFNYFEFRPTKIDFALNEKLCMEDILNLKKINYLAD